MPYGCEDKENTSFSELTINFLNLGGKVCGLYSNRD
jgi:hypothetical protein